MKILMVGGGAREDAICRNLSDHGHNVHACLSNRNPSILGRSSGYTIVSETDWETISSVASAWSPDLVFVSPDAALDTPLVDTLLSSGYAVASPSRKAAMIETSKHFMRSIMEKYSIEGNVWNRTFSDRDEMKKTVLAMKEEIVVKPLGLTGGKGVRVMGDHFSTREEGLAYAEEIIAKDGRVLIEEKLRGEEFSLQAFCDGSKVIPMPLAQDYKRAFEGDTGPNTGGMGSITDSSFLLPFVTGENRNRALRILEKIAVALREEGSPFTGILYGQFMVSREGVRVIEINARFADPEGINMLALMDDDLGEVLMKVATGDLNRNVKFTGKASVLKYVVPVGYGSAPEPGDLSIDREIEREDVRLFYASVSGTMERVTMSRSRALAIVALSDSIPEASGKVDASLAMVHGKFSVRKDIGTEQMIRKKMQSLGYPAP